jgi:hypothetical protein
MNIGEIIAKSVFSGYDFLSLQNPDKTINLIQNSFDKLYEKEEQLFFLNYILRETESEYLLHKSKCIKEICEKDLGYERIKYFLTSEMRKLDVIVDDKNYTEDELNKVFTILEELKASIEHLKMSNEIIYNDLIDEIGELKNLTYLGKKKLTTMLVGKITELTLGGYVSKLATDIIEKYKLIDTSGVLKIN